MDIVITSLITFFFTIIFTISIIPFLKRFFLDIPNKRSSHLNATPSGGGLGFIMASFAVSFRHSLLLPILSLPLAIVGFFDDLINLSPLKRIFVQTLTLIVFYYSSPLKNILGEYNLLNIIFIPLILLLGIYLINIINFADGLDGLLAGCMCIILLYYSINIDKSFFPIFSALLGFQILNWEPAKVFMGDGGSTFLGAIYVGLIYYSNSFEQIFELLLLSFPLICDTSITLLRRFLSGHNIFKAHKLHLFQRIYQAGYSHRFVSTIYISAISSIAIALSFKSLVTTFIVLIIIFCSGIYLDNKVAVPFSK